MLNFLNQNGMTILTISKSANATRLWFDDNKMYICLEDGRELSVPIDWFPTLRDATREERENWRLIGDGEGIHWEDLDEDILVEGLL
jgi:hypothetical protein